jgi:ankyrin repeat protein
MLLAVEKLGRKSGKLEVLEYLLAEGGNPDAEMSGFTPLISAAMGGSVEGVRALLDAGADPTKAGRMFQNDITPIGAALFSDKPEIVKLLAAAGADVSAPAYGDMSAMDYATLLGKTDLAKVLAEAGADVNQPGRSGAGAMHMAARKGDIDTLQSMLKSGGDPNGRDDFGKTPLHHALAGGHADAAKLLLDAGADVNATDDNGGTPLMDAASSRSGAAVRLALGAGADPDARNNNGQHAAEMGQGVDEAVDPIVEASPEIQENREAPEIEEDGEVAPGSYNTPCAESGGGNLGLDVDICGAAGSYRITVSLIREDGTSAGKVVPPLCEPFDFKAGSSYRITVLVSSYDWEWDCRYELKSTTGDTTILSYKKETNKKFSEKTIEVTVPDPNPKPEEEEEEKDLEIFLVWDPDGVKFAFDDSSDGVLELIVEAVVSGDIDPETVEWSMDKIGNSKMTIEPERGAAVTIRFEGLPEWNNDFGEKTITARAGGKSDSMTVEVYFDPKAKNHPHVNDAYKGWAGVPNWFYYWGLSSAGRGYKPEYDPGARSCTGAAVVGQYNYERDAILLTDGVIDSVCIARAGGKQARGFDCYAETLRHENVHRKELRAWWEPLGSAPAACVNFDNATRGKSGLGSLIATLGEVAKLAGNIPRVGLDKDGDMVPDSVENELATGRGCDPANPKSCSGRPQHLNVIDVEMNAYTIGWAAWPPCSAPAEDWSRDGQQWTGECD